jgi:hypothetical protein
MRLLLVLTAAAIGCGAAPPDAPDPVDLGERVLGDAHVLTGCMSKDDCDDLDPCTIDNCQLDHTCGHKPIVCTMQDDACNAGVCDPKTVQCKKMPANEGKPCTVTTTTPGACQAGVCLATPQCTVSITHGCSSSNRTRTATTSGTSKIDGYACAAMETGPELAYRFRLTTERAITLTLTGLTNDLDLIVLSGTFCTANATCVAQSLNSGTANESVSFTALANTDYVIVVDGKNGASGTFTLTASCGDCAGSTALACNMTVLGNTSTSAQKSFNGYTCSAAQPGPEVTYQLNPPVDTSVALKLTGLTQDLDLVVMGDSSGLCDPTWCRYQSLTAGAVDEAVSIPSSTTATKYWVAVDSPGATGGPYQLEVACSASCKNTSNSMSCSTPSDTRRNDDAVKSRNLINTWSCATGMTGPEVVYYIYATTAGTITVETTGTTADLDLIVVEGTFSLCDPLGPCLGTGGRTVGSGDESVTFPVTGGKYYWVAVDGRNGAVSPYQLKMRASFCPGPTCYQSANKLSCSFLEDKLRSDDATRSKNAIDTWACAAGMTGPEVVYQFKPPVTGMYTVTLDELTADLDLLVLSSTSSSTCDSASACVAQSTLAGTASETVSFMGDAARYYFFAVDGKANASGPFHIKVASTSCPAPICQNGFRSLACAVNSRSLSNINNATYATSNVVDWACATGLNGPEFAHQFTPTGPGPYTFELIGLSANLDLIVMEAGASSACNPAATCVAATALGTSSEKITNFTADPTKTYWLIVDGKDGAVSPYTLAVTGGCP